MYSSFKFVFILLLSVTFQSVSAQMDSSNFPKKVKKAFQETEKNGGCSYFDYSIDNIDVDNPNCAGEITGMACVDLSSITPVGAYTIIWSGPDGHPEDGATTPCINGLGAGTWVAAVFNEDSEGCVVVVEITEPAAMTVINWGIQGATLVPPTCFGQCDGRASPLVFGGPGDGSGPFEFLYDNGDTTQVSTNLCDPFVLTITDSNGCSRDFDYDFVNGPEAVQADSTITNTCFGETNGAIDLSVSGGNPIPVSGYLFSWYTVPGGIFSTQQNISGLGPGTYYVDITDGSPCTITKEYLIEESDEIVLTPTISDLLCFGDVNGGINPNVSGGVSPYGYSWTGTNVQTNNADQTNLPSGDYIVVVTDSIGCSVSEDFTLAAPDSIAITGVINPVSCFGESNGSITLNVTGGAPAYQSYSWDVPACYAGPTNTPNISSLCGGVYEVTVVDSDNCSMSATFEVLEPESIVLELSKSDETCFGVNDGFITLVITGGAEPQTTPSWNPLPFTVDGNGIKDLAAGIYTVEYTDANTCVAIESIEIFGAEQITVVETIVHASCSNVADGSINLVITGAISPYNFISWENELGEEISNEEDISNLPAGDYTVTIEDANGCQFVNTYTIDAPEEIIITVENIQPVLCFGNNDGAIDISSTGGNNTFQYTWTGTPANPSPNNTEDVSGLMAGTYTVLIQSGSCQSTEIITLDPATEIELSFSVTQISCPGVNDGAIDMTIIGGVNPAQNITWTGPTCFTGANTEDISGLCPGTYFVLYTDDNGCEQSSSVVLDSAAELLIEGIVDDVNCHGESSGSIDISLNPAGGSPTYQWAGPDPFPGANTEDLSNINAGEYIVEVTVNGCVTTESFIVSANDSIYVDEIITPFPCNGNVLGSIDITPHGGLGPYTYFWPGIDPPNNTNEDQSDLESGTYLVIVTDSLGCFIQKEYNLAPTTEIDINGIVSDLSCFAINDGEISTDPTGGLSPYSFAWTGPNLYINNTEQNISNLLPGDYSLTVTDNDGCVVDTLMTINEPTEIVINVTSTDPTCGNNNGSITVNTTGGVGITTVTVTKDGISITDLSNLEAGLYVVEAVDGNNCSSSANVTLSNSEIDIAGVVTDINCNDDNNGAISITITGAIGATIITWVGDGPIDTPNGTTISNLIAGEYVVTVEDENGCIASQIFTVVENEEIIVAVDMMHVNCESDNDGSITITNTIGGQGVYTFIWNSIIHDDFEASTIDNLPPGFYELTVTDELNCSEVFNYEILSSIIIEISADITDVNCFGDDSGAIDITVSGGTPSYEFNWVGIGTDQDLIDLFSGEYFLEIIDESGCEKDTSFIVETSADLFSDAEVVNVFCAGDSTGSITLIDLGGTTPYSFNWSSTGFSSSNQNITGLVAEVYNLNITDSLNCQFDSTFTIQENNNILVEAEVSHVSCFNQNTGAILFTSITGGEGVITPTWSPVPAGSIIDENGISDIPSGDYLLTLTDVNGCTTTETYTVLSLNEAIAITADITHVFCAGQDNGIIEIMIEGGVPDYSISWTEVVSSESLINNLSPGTYSVHVMDNIGCEKDTSFVINETNPLVLNLESIEDNICSGDGIGAIDISIDGGSPEYNYTWTDGDGFFETTQDISGLDGGIYNVHVEDFNLCVLDQEFTINEPEELTFDLSVINSNCGLDDGSAEVLNILGGTSLTNYTVNWYNEATIAIGTGPNISDLAPGVYSVVIIDDNGCIGEESFTISDNTGEISALIAPISCPNDSDGAITVSITGLTRPIVFEWTSDLGFGSADSAITNLSSDNYTITVIDSLNCQIVETYNLQDPDLIEVLSTVTNESCPDENDGSINLIVSGGTGELTYAWTGVGIIDPQNQDQINLPPDPGDYSVTITDENTCSSVFDFTIQPASEFDIVADINPISCFDANDASILITVDFGSFPPIDDLTFFWQGPNVLQNQKDQFNLGPGTYELTITTPIGCEVESSYEIEETSEILIDVTTSNSTCSMDDGGAIVMANGGVVVSDYQYAWFEGSGNLIAETSNTLSNVGAGLYEVIVTDDNGCSVNQNFVISDDGGILTYDVDSVSCPGLSDGAIDITYSGLTEPVGIIWSGPDGTVIPDVNGDIENVPAGEYTVLITSIDGCILGDVIPVEEQDFINSFANILDITCQGESDGAIDITVTGGTPDYTFDWMGPLGSVTSDVNGDVENLDIGEYTVTITDSDGCSGFALYSIDEPQEITIVSNLQDATCFGSNDGFINIVNVEGGSGIYSYSWTKTEDIDFGSTFPTINDLTAGTYNLTITDSNDCVYSESFTINNNSQLTLELTTEDANCGLPSGGASVLATGGTNSYTYQWFDSDSFLLDEDSDTITSLVQGSYSVIVTDENGCSENTEFSIQNADYSVTAAISNVNCFGNNDGEIAVTLSDDFSTPIVGLTWSGPFLSDPPPTDLTLVDLVAGTYTLSLSDSNGCPFTDDYEVLQPDSISIATIVGNVSCFGESTGSIVLSPTGGTPYEMLDPAYTFNWTVPSGATDPGNTHFSESLPVGSYSVNVTDSLNCVNTIDIELTEPTALTLIAAVNSPVCENDADGSIQVIVSGGTEGDGYIYNWSNDETVDLIDTLTIGDYTVNITDENECQLDSTFIIAANIILNLAYDINDVTCFDLGDGSIDLTPSGGSEEFIYNWNAEMDAVVDNLTTEDLNNLLGGEYYLTLTDTVNGCVKMDTLLIINPDSLYANTLLIQEPLCFGQSTGIINLETLGGTDPFDFNWVSSDPDFDQTGDSIINLIAGSYNLEISDSSNCTKSYEFILNEPEALLFEVDDIQNAFCYTSEDGSISTSISGGIPDYSIDWINETGDEFVGESITGLIAGNYYINITDSNNCVIQDTVLLSYDEEIIAVIQDQDPACDQLAVTLDGAESIGVITYNWIDNGDQTISNEAFADITLSLDYNEFILDVSNGVCSHQDTLTLVVNALPVIDAGEDVDAFPDEVIEIGGNPAGPTAIIFNWQPGELLSDSIIANPTYLNLGTQQFYLTITDGNNCQNRDSVLITLINEVIIPDGFSPNADGKNDVWVITNSNKFPDMVVKVFSRWGDMLFESKGYNTPWGGQYEGGYVPVGTYYYVIELKDPLFPKPFTGPLTIFR